ncbi:hypothetical protein ACFMPD_03965 [Sedimentitalea sp. HM32M-2]|uniref:hypothetical protein n=1 Tax=Sedimentitalea sp. HM32M-2 TaxID=3351566 RepID=UPI00363BCC55
MSLSVHPDPQHPAGGYAFLELPAGSLPDAQVTVAVFDAYGERWLAPSGEPGGRITVGDGNWQSERIGFGPYEVHRHDGADWVRIGPEIVNKLQEYAPLRIEVDRLSFDIAWPDDVPPRAGAAVLGGLQPVVRKPAEVRSDQLIRSRLPKPPAPEVEAAPRPASDAALTLAQETRRGSRLLRNLVLTALLVLALAIWYFWPRDTAPVAKDAGVRDAACSPAALAAVPGGFAATADAIRTCGADVPPGVALRLVEEAADRDDADALLLFGTLYDGARLDARIENLIGLTFEDDPAKAAEYYARAVRAGATDASKHLAAVCRTLSGANATLAKGAHDDFCS